MPSNSNTSPIFEVIYFETIFFCVFAIPMSCWQRIVGGNYHSIHTWVCFLEEILLRSYLCLAKTFPSQGNVKKSNSFGWLDVCQFCLFFFTFYILGEYVEEKMKLFSFYTGVGGCLPQAICLTFNLSHINISTFCTKNRNVYVHTHGKCVRYIYQCYSLSSLC